MCAARLCRSRLEAPDERPFYILEAKPRASRIVPLVSKVTGIPLANIATQIIALGKKIPDFPERKEYDLPHVAVKEAVFPFNMFPEVDPVFGPEMRATGEITVASLQAYHRDLG